MTGSPRIAIVGAGVSGVLTAAQIARHWPDGPAVAIFERAGRGARGLAYDTFEPGHLLNVRAANMSAFPDKPQHFERWLSHQRDDSDGIQRTEAGDFVPRSVYGRYLESILEDAFLDGRGQTVRVVHGDVHRLKRVGRQFELRLADERAHLFDAVVLAMGNVGEGPRPATRVFPNPWLPGATMELDPDKPVLIQGTGLTMVDLVIALRRRGFRGPIVALSRRGLTPQVHAATSPWPARRLEDTAHSSLVSLLRHVRADIEHAADIGACWRSPVDALRGITQELWMSLAPADKARFLRHLRPYWESHRHRIAPPIARQLEQERALGSLRIVAGRIHSQTEHRDGLRVIFKRRGGELDALEVQRMIVATGIPDLSAARDSFIDSLVAEGHGRFDQLGIGLDVDHSLALLDGEGEPSGGLWAIGPLVRGVFWECVAVPDIRVQASHVAHAVKKWLKAKAGSPPAARMTREPEAALT